MTPIFVQALPGAPLIVGATRHLKYLAHRHGREDGFGLIRLHEAVDVTDERYRSLLRVENQATAFSRMSLSSRCRLISFQRRFNSSASDSARLAGLPE